MTKHKPKGRIVVDVDLPGAMYGVDRTLEKVSDTIQTAVDRAIKKGVRESIAYAVREGVWCFFRWSPKDKNLTVDISLPFGEYEGSGPTISTSLFDLVRDTLDCENAEEVRPELVRRLETLTELARVYRPQA